MYHIYRNLSIRNKIVVIILVICLLTNTISAFFDYKTEMDSQRTNQLNFAKQNAHLIGQYCAMPLFFESPPKARDALSKLKSDANIEMALLFDSLGRYTAAFPEQINKNGVELTKQMKCVKYLQNYKYLQVYEPIYYQDSYCGSLYILMRTNINDYAKHRINITIVLIISMSVFALILSSFMQKLISSPIIELTNFIEKISVSGDYSMRIEQTDKSETGKLLMQYNQMLETIQNKEEERNQAVSALKSSREQYKLLSNLTLEGILIMEDDLIKDVNQSFCELICYDKNEILSKQFIEFTSRNKNDKKELSNSLYEDILVAKNTRKIPVEIEIRFFQQDGRNLKVLAIRDISERKKMMQKLSESEHLLKRIVETNPNMIYIYDLIEKKNIYVNREIYNDLGYLPEEISAMGENLFKQILHPEDAMKVATYHAQFTNAGYSDVFEIEYRMKTADNRWRWIKSRDVLFLNNNNQVQQILGSAMDITNQKNAEKQIKKEKEKAESYLNIVEVILVALDINGRISLLNRKGYQVLGYKLGELEGENWFETCIPKSESDSVFQFYTETINGDVQNIEYHENMIVTKSGEHRWIAWHNNVITNETGDIIGCLSSGEDITERKIAEKALIESEKKYKDLFENMNDAFVLQKIIVDSNNIPTDFIFLDANPVFLKQIDLDLKTLKSKNGKNIFPEIQQEILLKYGETALSGIPQTFTHHNQSNNTYYETRIYSPANTLFACLTTDVTEKTLASMELSRNREHLEELVKERTKQLNEEISEHQKTEMVLIQRSNELEIFNKAMIDREIRIIEMKKEVNSICKEVGKEIVYQEFWA